MNPVTIYLEKENNFTSASDKDEQCMKAAVTSYIFKDEPESGYYNSGNMFILHLREFTYPVKYVNNEGVEVQPLHTDKEIDVAALATESLLKRLKAAQCIENKNVAFQARRGLPPNYNVSGITCMRLEDGPPRLVLSSQEQGIIKNTYAYLSERKICLFLRNDVTPEQVKKIDDALRELFPHQ